MYSGAGTLSGSGAPRYAQFVMNVYCHDYKDFLDSELFAAMHSSEDAETVYNSRNGLYRDAAGDASFGTLECPRCGYAR